MFIRGSFPVRFATRPVSCIIRRVERESLDVRAVIFDMDGLLLDTEQLARLTWQRAARDCGVDLDDALFVQLIGRTRRDSNAILERAWGSAVPLDTFRTRCSELWEEVIANRGIPVKTGVSELLDLLDAIPLPRAVATSTGRAAAERCLRMVGLLARFDHLVTGDQVERGKPAPDIFLHAAERLEAAPETCLVLEDSLLGITAAHAAGMIPVMVPDLVPPTDEIERIAYRIATSLHDVHALLAETLSRRVW